MPPDSPDSSSKEPRWEAPRTVSYPWWLEIVIGTLFLSSGLIELVFRSPPPLGEIAFHGSAAFLFFSVGLGRRVEGTGHQRLHRALWWGKVVFGVLAGLFFTLFLAPDLLEAIWS